MKTLFITLLLTIFTFSINAQGRSSKLFVDAIKRDKNMERIGTVLSVLGGTTLFVGNVLYWKVYHNNSTQSTDYVNAYRGAMLTGLGLIAIGVPIWSSGKANERHLKIQAEVVQFKGLASACGVGLKIRF
jgi:hypothetical protein